MKNVKVNTRSPMGTVVNSVTYPGDAVLIDISASDAASAAGAGAQNDHGGLSGLLDDDHTQYLNETRHDALSADNPHSVTFTQAVTADAGTNITAAEAETLTDTSNADLLHAHAHNSLTGLNNGTSYEHLTATQVSALQNIKLFTEVMG